MKNGRILNVRLDAAGVARSLSDRCRMILRCADGLTNKAVAAELGVHGHTVGKWRRRFLKERIDGLSDEPRPGRPRTLTDEKVAAVIERTLETTPADATHWCLRSMARESGADFTNTGHDFTPISQNTGQRFH